MRMTRERLRALMGVCMLAFEYTTLLCLFSRWDGRDLIGEIIEEMELDRKLCMIEGADALVHRNL